MRCNVLFNARRIVAAMVAMFLFGAAAQAQAVDNQKNNNESNNVEYVKFVEVSATKTYPEGNQVTYVKATGLPNDRLVADLMEKHLIENMRVNRMRVYLNHDEFLLDADADINPEHVVDEMNIFLREYYRANSEVGRDD